MWRGNTKEREKPRSLKQSPSPVKCTGQCTVACTGWPPEPSAEESYNSNSLGFTCVYVADVAVSFPCWTGPSPSLSIWRGDIITENCSQQIEDRSRWVSAWTESEQAYSSTWHYRSDSSGTNEWWCRASCPRMSVDILGTNCNQCRSMVRCCSNVHSFCKAHYDGKPRTATSTFTQLLNSDPNELTHGL